MFKFCRQWRQYVYMKKDHLNTRLDNQDVNWVRRQNRNTVLDISHTLHFRLPSQTAPLRIPAHAEEKGWQDGPWITLHYNVPHRRKNPPMILWRYFGRKKRSFSNRESGHNQRQLELLSNQFRKWDSVVIIARRTLSTNAINAISVLNMSANLLYAARSWQFSYPFTCYHLCCLIQWQIISKLWRCKITLNKRLFETFTPLYFPPHVISVLK